MKVKNGVLTFIPFLRNRKRRPEQRRLQCAVHARLRQEPAGYEAHHQPTTEHGQPRVPHDEPGSEDERRHGWHDDPDGRRYGRRYGRRPEHPLQPVFAELSVSDVVVAERGPARRRRRDAGDPHHQHGDRFGRVYGRGAQRQRRRRRRRWWWFDGLSRFDGFGVVGIGRLGVVGVGGVVAAAAGDHPVSGGRLRATQPVSDATVVRRGRIRSRLLQRPAARTAAAAAAEAQRDDCLTLKNDATNPRVHISKPRPPSLPSYPHDYDRCTATFFVSRWNFRAMCHLRLLANGGHSNRSPFRFCMFEFVRASSLLSVSPSLRVPFSLSLSLCYSGSSGWSTRRWNAAADHTTTTMTTMLRVCQNKTYFVISFSRSDPAPTVSVLAGRVYLFFYENGGSRLQWNNEPPRPQGGELAFPSDTQLIFFGLYISVSVHVYLCVDVFLFQRSIHFGRKDNETHAPTPSHLLVPVLHQLIGSPCLRKNKKTNTSARWSVVVTDPRVVNHRFPSPGIETKPKRKIWTSIDGSLDYSHRRHPLVQIWMSATFLSLFLSISAFFGLLLFDFKPLVP